ncbi:MAG: sulfurtransferase complex subunit TusD [Cellvibrionaceae bacterium]
MIFSLTILSAPSSQASYSAYQFAKALLLEGHSLYRIFFYHDGSYHGSQLNCSPQDEIDLSLEWQQLQKQHSLDIVVCIAAGLKRGIIDSNEANRYDKPSANLIKEFELSGLGQLVDAAVISDRMMTFGA